MRAWKTGYHLLNPSPEMQSRNVSNHLHKDEIIKSKVSSPFESRYLTFRHRISGDGPGRWSSNSATVSCLVTCPRSVSSPYQSLVHTHISTTCHCFLWHQGRFIIYGQMWPEILRSTYFLQLIARGATLIFGRKISKKSSRGLEYADFNFDHVKSVTSGIG